MKKKLLILIGILFIFNITNVSALSLGKAGDSVVEEGEYDSIRFIAGNNVINKANIDGLSFIAGNEITTEGVSSYGIYAGNNINIKENILKDLFVAGNKITLYEDAIIGRDVFIAGANVTILTNIARDLRIGANNINISGITIEGDAYLYADNITLDANTIINGKLTYLEDTNIKGLDVAKVGKVVTTKKVDIENTRNLVSNPVNNIKKTIFSICAGIIIMLILFYMLPKTKDKLEKVELKIDVIVKTVCIGFLILILVPMIFVMTVFTNILTPFALILACVYGIGIYLGSLLSAYIIGNILIKKIFNKDNKYLALIIGIVIVKLIKLVPYIGGFISVIFLLYGMGLITKYLKSRNM